MLKKYTLLIILTISINFVKSKDIAFYSYFEPDREIIFNPETLAVVQPPTVQIQTLKGYTSINNANSKLTQHYLPTIANSNSTLAIENSVIQSNKEVLSITKLNFFQYLPLINNVDDWVLCTINNNGTAEFYLPSRDDEILDGANPNLYDITYYLSSNDAQNEDSPIVTYSTSTTTTIFVRIEEISSGSVEIQDFEIIPIQAPIVNGMTDIYTCHDTTNPGEILDIDLNDHVAQAYGIQNQTDFDISFHTTNNNAETNTDPLTDLIYSTTASSNPKTIYVRLENVSYPECYDVGTFELHFEAMPNPQQQPDLYSCLDETTGTAIFDASGVAEYIKDGNPEYQLMFFDENLNEIGETLPDSYESPSTTITVETTLSYEVCYSYSPDDFTINDDAFYTGNDAVQLTSDNETENGSVWANIMLDLNSNFTIKSELFLGYNNSGADGIAFVLQPLTVNEGGAGGGIGYEDISPSLAVEFDTYYNSDADPISNDHVAIIKNGNPGNMAAHSEFVPAYNAGNLEDGAWHPAEFQWDAENQVFTVTLDGTIILTAGIDIINSVFNGSPYVYWGFTAATGGESNIQMVKILDYCLAIQEVNCAKTMTFDLIAVPEFTMDPIADLEICDDDNDGFGEFDTSSIHDLVLANFDDPDRYIIEYFDGANNPLPSPLPDTLTNSNINLENIHIGVTDTLSGCYVTNMFSLIVYPKPEVITPEPLYACDLDGDGYTTFMLNTKNAEILDGQPGINVFYYETMEDLEASTNTLSSNYTNIYTPTQTLYVKLVTTSTGCHATTTLELVVSEPPVANVIGALEYCDNDNDGYGIFDIESVSNAIIPNDGQDYNVTFHETITDAENNVNEFYSMYENIVPDNQTIYVRVENDLSGCYDIEPLDLIVHHTPIVPVNLDDLEICDDNVADGFAEFDLSLQNPAVFGSQSTTEFTVSYHASLTAAENGTGDLPQFYTNIYAYTQTIYVRLENNTTGCYTTREFELIVNPNPVIASDYDHDLALCDDFGEPGDEITVFDLTVENDDITGGVNGYAVSYFHNMTDARNSENQIIPDTAYQNAANAETLYVRVEDVNTGCASYTTVTLRVLNNPSPNANMEPQETCDDDTDGDENNGQAVFDLTFDELALLNGENQVTPVYYESYDDAFNQVNEIADPTNYYNITPYLQTIYVRVTNDATACFTIVDFDLIVHPLPAVNQDNMFYVCELDNDFTETFPLTDMDSFVMDGGDTTDLEISYYNSLNDAENDIAELVGPNITVNGTRDIFARVFDTVNECVQTLAFTIEIRQAPIANKPDNVALCDVLHELADGTIIPMNDGVEIFDLTQVIEQIRGQQDPNTFIVSIYYTQQEAIDMVNPMEADDIIAYETATTTLYAIVTNTNTGCINGEPVEINLIVEPLAEVVLTQSGIDILCVDATNNPIIGSDLGAGYTYLWNTGATTPTIEVTEGGEYFVEVINTNTYNQCSFTSNTVVYQEASLPGVTPRVIQSEAFQGEDTIAVIAEGAGVSEYSYELETGEYNTTGIFTNVTPGFHTITITELNGCGSMTIQVSVIDYMRYFTPNGDGVNDNWHIIGLESQQNAQVFIFDRHGKLLKQLSATSEGWNGFFNGSIMPSNDYWFKVIYTEPTSGEVKEYTNHFSLKR